MVTYEEALKKANEILPGVNKCVEYKKGYMFARNTKSKEIQYGGSGAPVVILKENGKAVSMAWFASINDSEPIREFKV